MRNLLSCLLALALAPVAVACSSGYSSGVDGSKPVSTLTASEAALACESLEDYLLATFQPSDVDRINCYIRALGMETSPEGCQAAYEACLVDPPGDGFQIGSLECTGATPDPTCNARISDVEQCVTAQVSAADARFDMLSCDIAGNITELQRLQQPLPIPTECSSLGDTCPEFADGIFM